MEDNPYYGIINTMRDEANGIVQNQLLYGIVQGISPLKIEVSGTIQDQSTIKMGATQELKKGDTVLLATLDNSQTFIVICKVV